MKTVKQILQEEWIPELKKAKEDLKRPKTFYKQIPNLLTASRLISPLVIIPVALTTNVLATFIVASLFALTDAVDGKIARKLKIESKLGSMLDAVTDKLFVASLLIPKFVSFPIVTCSFIGLEAIITKINVKSKLKENHPQSNLLGKVKSGFLFATVIAMYLSNISIIRSILPILFISTFALQIQAAIVYDHIDKEKDSNNKKIKNFMQEIENTHLKKSKELDKTITNSKLKEQLEKEKESLLEQPEVIKPKQKTKNS